MYLCKETAFKKVKEVCLTCSRGSVFNIWLFVLTGIGKNKQSKFDTFLVFYYSYTNHELFLKA